MKNYVTETMLKGAFPELTKYLWKGETNYDKQKSLAEEIVTTELVTMGYDIRKLQIPLHLRTAGSISTDETGTEYTDEISRQRFYYNVTAVTGAATLTLKGRNSTSDSYETVLTVTLSAAAEASVFFSNVFKYYRLDTTVGTSINFYAYLVENTYCPLFKWKELELIMMNNGSNYTDQLIYCRDEYNRVMKKAKIYYDANDSRTITRDEAVYNSQPKLSAG